MRVTRWDRFLSSLAPGWGTARLRARAVAEQLASVPTAKRHYEAAAPGRRTSGWPAQSTFLDADLSLGLALIQLRAHARDLVRNNGWARRGQRVIANNTVGTGLVPKASGPGSATAQDLWRGWADSVACSANGRRTFGAMQHLIMRALVQDGEALVLRVRNPDGGPVPIQLKLLESDYLDHTKMLLTSDSGGPIIRGVELDKNGRRAGYWLFANHPGSGRNAAPSKFVPASDVLHIYEDERPGQTRGVSWLAAAIVPLKDLSDLEDAELVKQKIAACFTAFVTDLGPGEALGEQDGQDPLVEAFEPGMITQLPPGKTVEFGTPPVATLEQLPTRTLRRVAAALGVTYEDLSGDYSQVNFSSARMGRLSHWANVRHWQHNILVPQLCQPVWAWAMEAAQQAGELDMRARMPSAVWTAPPMPMLEPDREGQAYSRLIRNGLMSQSEAIREQGYDPAEMLAEMAADNARLDELGITLDSDPRRTTSTGQAQQAQGPAPDLTGEADDGK